MNASILHPVRAGFNANILVAWIVAPRLKTSFGEYAAKQKSVSHCYERRTTNKWPYAFYTMIHGKDYKSCKSVIEKIVNKTNTKTYLEMSTLVEYKKERVIYYT